MMNGVIANARLRMSGHIFRSPDRCYAMKLLIAAIASCACIASPTRGDERPAKPSGTAVSDPRSGSARESAKPSQQQIEKRIRDLGDPNYAARQSATNDL